MWGYDLFNFAQSIVPDVTAIWFVGLIRTIRYSVANANSRNTFSAPFASELSAFMAAAFRSFVWSVGTIRNTIAISEREEIKISRDFRAKLMFHYLDIEMQSLFRHANWPPFGQPLSHDSSSSPPSQSQILSHLCFMSTHLLLRHLNFSGQQLKTEKCYDYFSEMNRKFFS